MSKVQITITGDPQTGHVEVGGPLPQVMLMSWLLREGNRLYDIWLAEQAKKQQQRVVPVTSIEPFVRGNGHGP